MNMRVVALCLASAGCADVPDYDDPRQASSFEEDPHLTCANLLANGTFDATPIAWTLQPADIVVDTRKLPSDNPFYPASGYYFAWFGGAMSTTRTASQRIVVPRTKMLKLSGMQFIAAVTTAGRIEDTLKIEITDDAGKVLATLASYSNLDSVPESATFVWKNLRTEFSSAAFAGQTVTFRITSVTDAANNTNFLFDSLQITPTGCF